MKLLERESALQSLGEAFAEAHAGRGRTVLVSGEAGIGKTALVAEFAASQSHARVLWGGCEALFSPRPLGPLYDIAPAIDVSIAGLLGRLGRRPELFAAVLAGLQSEAATVLIIEDVHWADAATLDLIKFLARRIPRANVLLVLTFRDDEIDAQHPLRLVLGDLPSAHVTRIALLPLSSNAVESLARATDRASIGLYELTHGNPFFVSEMLRAGGLSATLRDAVLSRVLRQPHDVRALLELAAIVPSRVERKLIDAVLAPAPDVIAAALSSGLLSTDGDRYVFRHELARIAVADAIAKPRSQTLHAQALAALEAGTVGTVPTTRLVHHAANAGDWEAVLRHAPQAAAKAASHGAHREAAALYRTALEHAQSADMPTRAEKRWRPSSKRSISHARLAIGCARVALCAGCRACTGTTVKARRPGVMRRKRSRYWKRCHRASSWHGPAVIERCSTCSTENGPRRPHRASARWPSMPNSAMRRSPCTR